VQVRPPCVDALLVGWRERDWARFTDAEWEAIYGRSPKPVAAQESAWTPPRGSTRSALRPGVGFAIAVSVAVLLAGQFPRGHPLVPALHINMPGSSSATPASPRQFPLNIPSTATYGSTLTINGTDVGGTSGQVVAMGRWNGGPPTTLASTALAADHSWSLPLSMNQQGTLAVTIELPSGNSLAGTVAVGP
jgi:hypothetical protein